MHLSACMKENNQIKPVFKKIFHAKCHQCHRKLEALPDRLTSAFIAHNHHVYIGCWRQNRLFIIFPRPGGEHVVAFSTYRPQVHGLSLTLPLIKSFSSFFFIAIYTRLYVHFCCFDILKSVGWPINVLCILLFTSKYLQCSRISYHQNKMLAKKKLFFFWHRGDHSRKLNFHMLFC